MSSAATERTRLSSGFTFFSKLVVPTIWISAFALETGLTVVNPSPNGPPALLLAIVTLVGAVVFWRWSIPLKKVIATDAGLLVSNFRREVLVPYAQISAVRERCFVSNGLITIELRPGSPLGRSFFFVPYSKWVLFSSHPATTLLRQRVEAERPLVGRSGCS